MSQTIYSVISVMKSYILEINVIYRALYYIYITKHLIVVTNLFPLVKYGNISYILFLLHITLYTRLVPVKRRADDMARRLLLIPVCLGELFKVVSDRHEAIHHHVGELSAFAVQYHAAGFIICVRLLVHSRAY